MALSAGTRLGPYEILSPIGAGGMGEVWKARDSRLDRIVAVKVSAAQFTERFEREARAVASLNHPHICTLHDVGPNYLVMEYIEGQPLKGPLPLDQALKYASQICEALDAAHRKGIVHRDLKPGNILVTRSGIKLLDFGLAKMNHRPAAEEHTETIALTKANTILGTLQYMAPEQLHGQDADARSDIFAFGAVLYEMVTGKRAFEGRSQASVIAAILERDPPSIAGVAPEMLDRLLRRCLAKEPDDRWQSARDLKLELDWIAAGGAAVPAATPVRPWMERGGWIALTAILAAVLWFLMARPHPDAHGDRVQFSVYPPPKTNFVGPSNITLPVPQFELSPDGRALVFVGAAEGSKPMLWLRPLDQAVSKPLSGTEDAQLPFWSPDSRWVGFFAEGKLKKVPGEGGPVQVVASGTGDPRGASWGPDGTILFAAGAGPVFRVSATGGAVAPATDFDISRKEASHRHPQFLPDGRHFLFSITRSDQGGFYVGSLDGKSPKPLFQVDLPLMAQRYALPGYLMSVNGDTLVGRAFDPDRLAVRGDPFVIAERVGRSTGGMFAVSVSSTGILAHSGPISRLGRPTWFDRGGNPIEPVLPEGDYSDFRLSPDGKRLAASLIDPRTGFPDIWLTDMARRGTSRFTFGPVIYAGAIWSPDNTHLAFRTTRSGLSEIYQKSAAGGADLEPLLAVKEERAAGLQAITLVATDWSPDGRNILLSAAGDAGAQFGLWLLPLQGDKKPFKLPGSPHNTIHGNFSPDGKQVAYSSDESGRFEVYVDTLPRSDRKWQVSINGGYEPRWRGDGREIYYLSEDRRLMAVAVGKGPAFDAPKPLFQTRVPAGVHPLRTNYVPSGDGRRFLINTQTSTAEPLGITVVLNWTTGLKR